jgi:GMP synthase (glutamine-hydrolysing)
MKMELVEPLRDLFKDEVRNMGSELGLSLEMLNQASISWSRSRCKNLGEINFRKSFNTSKCRCYFYRGIN